MDTIFALATAQGRAGVAVVRISGPAANTAAKALMDRVPASRGLRKLTDISGQVIDIALVLRFEKGHSFTGEDVIELHTHGSPAVVEALLDVLGQQPDLRMAEPGEFTQRAMENGQLDLAQVEGLADLIDAESESQRKQALAVFSGELGDRAEVWRADLIRAAALVEATIDFADEEVPTDVYPEVTDLLAKVCDDLKQQVAGFQAAERVRTGFEVAIVGPPNVGKSTLLNYLAGRDAAITSEVAGTTRDVIEVRMAIGGLSVTLLDTAGLRETDDVVEGLGIARAQERAAAADLRVFLTEKDGKPAIIPAPDDIVLMGKQDDGTTTDGISGLTGHGVAELTNRIATVLRKRASGAGLAVRARHRQAMQDGVTFLQTALDGIAQDLPADFLAADIRAALRSVDSLVGRVDVEDLLGEIFASFCIGK